MMRAAVICANGKAGKLIVKEAVDNTAGCSQKEHLYNSLICFLIYAIFVSCS